MAHPYYGDPTGGLANGNSRLSAPSTPGAGATSRSEPSSFQFDPPLFDFSLPSIPTTIPPRLAQIGRRLSEMSDQLLPVSPSYSEIELARSKSSRTIRSREEVPGMGDEPIMCPFCQKPLPPSLFVSHTGPHSHVPKRTPVKRTVSMMDANVGSRTPSQMRKSLDVLEKGGGVTEGQVAGSRSQTSPSNEKGVQRSQALAQGRGDPSEVKATAKATSVTPAIAKTPSVMTATSESLAPGIAEGDTANHQAATMFISDSDIKRWSALAGIAPEPVATIVDAEKKKEEKTIPILPPPPPPLDTTRKSSGRFNLFHRSSSSKERRKKDDDEDSEDEHVGQTGYAKLLGPGSDSEDEGRGKEIQPMQLHASPKEIQEQALATSPPVVTDHQEPANLSKGNAGEHGSGEDELKQVLREVLKKVNEMSVSHNTLLSSHSAILTSLKIARSNLVMAEANTEMLEAELKRLKSIPRPSVTAVARPAYTTSTTATRSPVTPTIAERRGPASAAAASGSQAPTTSSGANSEKARPMSLQLPPPSLNTGPVTSPASTSADHSKGVFGFWKGGEKRRLPGGLGNVTIPTLPTGAQIMSAIEGTRPTTPTGEKVPIFDFHGFPMATPEPKTPTARRSLEQPSSAVVQRASTPTSATRTSSLNSTGVTATVPSHTSELTRLRQATVLAQSRMDVMAKELVEMKKGKVDMEMELENLSQALFEEANKMVAEERRKRAEAEEAIKEVKEEREALRETIKVLGGKVDDASSRASTVDDEEEEETDENPFAPRDLDKHYEALRKTIHHVGEGVGGDEADQVMSGIGVIPGVGGPDIMPIPDEAKRSGLEMVPAIAPLSPNPWASAEPFNLPPQPAVPTLRVIEGTPQESISRSGAEEIGQVEVGKNESRSQVEELDRLMERLQQEAKD